MVFEDQTHNAESQDKVSAQGGLCSFRKCVNSESEYHPDGITRVSWIESESAIMLIFTPRATRTLFWLAYEVGFDEIVYFVDQLIPGVTSATNVISVGKEHHDMEFPIVIRKDRYVLWAFHAFLGELDAYMVESEVSGRAPVLSSSKAYHWWRVIAASVSPADWITRLPIDRNNRSTSDVVRAAIQYRDEHLFPLEIKSSRSSEFDDFIFKVFPMFKLPLMAQLKVSEALRGKITQMYCTRNEPWTALSLLTKDDDLVQMFVDSMVRSDVPIVVVTNHYAEGVEYRKRFLSKAPISRVMGCLSNETDIRDAILGAPGLDSVVAIMVFGTEGVHERARLAADASKRKFRGVLVSIDAPSTCEQICE